MVVKRIYSTLFVLFVVLSAQASDNSERDFIRNNFPKFEEVFNQVITRVSYFCDDCYYGIAKKPGGYYLSATPFESSEPTKYVLVWDRSNAAFVDFDGDAFASTQRLGHEPPAEFMNNYQQAETYDFYFYYGYNGWVEDTRALLHKNIEKSAEDLEILARTYANEAIEAAHPGMTDNYVDLSDLFEDKGFAKATSVQKAYFEKAADQSLAYWKELKRTSPNYITLNGESIDLKLSNEYMHFYQLAKSIKAVGLSSAYFRNIYFDEAWVQFARNVLGACEKDGFLFTSGSNDTYPIIFAQEKLGIREDVLVINRSLLNTGWYWEMILEENQIATRIKTKEYRDLSDKPLFIDYEAAAVPYKQWLEKTLKEGTDESYWLVPNNIFLNYLGTNMELELKTQNLLISDLIVLDILSNNTERKAYTSAPYGFVRMGLYQNLAPTGRSFSIVPDRTASMEDIKTIENIEDLAFYSTPEYLDALGNAAEREFSMLSYLIINVSPVFRDRQEKLIEKIYKQLPPQKIVDTEDFKLIEAVNAFYEVVQPEACMEVQTSFKPLAEDFVLNTSALSKDLEQRIEKMELIFSIYAHFRVLETPEFIQPDFEKPVLTDLEKSILLQVQAKAIKLYDSPVVKRRSVVRQKLYRLLSAIDLLELD